MDESSQLIANLQFQRDISYPVKHNVLKRTFDIVFSIIALLITSPLLLLVYLLIRYTSQGNVFYSQERIGRGGITFKCYKFRTMYVDAEERLTEILNNDPTKKLEWELYHKLKNDPRITFIGSFLRKTSLDELPQFWNVLKGDLSVVGPRPVVQEEIDKHYGSKAKKILSIRPGITGIWQTSGRNDLSYSKRIALDERYIDTHSFLLDLKVVAITIPCMLSKKGAY